MIGRMARLGRAIPAPGWMAIALVAGFAIGMTAAGATTAIALAQLIGNLWIDALRMTLIPLIFALVTTSMATLARRGDGGAIGRRLPLLMIALLLMATLIAIALTPPLLALHHIPPEVVRALRTGLAPPAAGPTPSWIDTIRSFVPVNVVAAAAQGAIVPLVVFATVMGLALGRIDPAVAAPTLAPLRGLAEAMMTIVGWVLRVAVIGIFALAFAIGATAGIGAVAALGHYILVHVTVALATVVALYGVVRVAGRVPLVRFARAIAPAQAVAAGTQSSIASLPAMLASAGRLGIAEGDAGLILSFAVAVFKITAGTGSIVFSLGMLWLAGIDVAPTQLIVAIPLALLSTLTVLGVPGPGSVIAAATPVALLLGAPLELLPILLAVDTIPDMFRTLANVTADVTLLTIVATPVDDTQEPFMVAP